MVTVTIELVGRRQEWRIHDIVISLDADRHVHLGHFQTIRSYERCVEEGKDLAMLKLRHDARHDGVDEVAWRVETAEIG
ncbi:hypothetical protein [Candidatus Nitrospira bockiana]